MKLCALIVKMPDSAMNLLEDGRCGWNAGCGRRQVQERGSNEWLPECEGWCEWVRLEASYPIVGSAVWCCVAMKNETWAKKWW